MAEDYRIGRYTFNSEEEYLSAKKEYNTIKVLTEKYNLKDPKVARIVLSKFTPKTVFGEKFVEMLRKNCESDKDDELLESLDAAIKESGSEEKSSMANSAEFIAMKCPNCGSALEISSGISEYKCEYCGHRIILNNEIRIKADIKLKELEHEERKLDKSIEFEKFKMQKEEEEKEKAANKKKKIWKTVGLIWAALTLIGIIGTAIDYKINPDDYNNRVVISDSAKSIEGQNYKIIMAELQDAGFTNIEAIGMEDLKWSLFKDNQKLNGTIDRISINGISDFSSDTSFPLDAAIRISYHSFPQQAEQQDQAAVTSTETPTQMLPDASSVTSEWSQTDMIDTTQTAETVDAIPDYSGDSQSDDDMWAPYTGEDGKQYRYYKKEDPNMIVQNDYPIIPFLEITGYCNYDFLSDVTIRFNQGKKEYNLDPTYDVIFTYQMENLADEPILAEIWFRPTLTVNGVEYQLNEMGFDQTCVMNQRAVLGAGQKSDVLRVCFSGYDNEDTHPIPVIKEGSSILLNLTLRQKKNSESDWLEVPVTIDLLTGDFPEQFGQ